jgi:hypothetical protein
MNHFWITFSGQTGRHCVLFRTFTIPLLQEGIEGGNEKGLNPAILLP